jgi:hypothetical protein
MTISSHPAGSGPVTPAEPCLGAPTPPTSDGRRLPFTLRVAMVWTNTTPVPREGAGVFHYWRRAPLTGTLVSTSGGRDVSFSDLEL